MKNRSLVLLSGEATTLPRAEAESLFKSLDPRSSFSQPEPRVLIVDSEGDPFDVGSRVAFSRRVGLLVEDLADSKVLLKGKRVRFRNFDLRPGLPSPDPHRYLDGVDGEVDLKAPDLELTLVRGESEYMAVTAPGSMRQGWALRRPRSRAYFHPSAIFPKLSRALVNLSWCREGRVFLDPFGGTGSLAIEASIAGGQVVVLDRAAKMVEGSLRNMRQFGQSWLGAIRADANHLPLAAVDAIATDVPYGRASSTMGRTRGSILRSSLEILPSILRPGSKMVVMHNQVDEVEGSSELALEEEHHLYVHKLLTRTISVLRRR